MNEKAVRILALEASIRKWKKNLKKVKRKEIPHIGSEQCPCCKVYPDDDCSGCPIKEFTDRDSCYETPYYAVHELCKEALQYPVTLDWELFEDAVFREIEFLRFVLEAKKV